MAEAEEQPKENINPDELQTCETCGKEYHHTTGHTCTKTDTE